MFDIHFLLKVLGKIDRVYNSTNYVVVGGASEVLRGLKETTKDIDLVVIDPIPLVPICDKSLLFYGTKYPLCYIDGVMIDIKVEDDLEDVDRFYGVNIDIVDNAIEHKTKLLSCDLKEKDRVKFSRSVEKLNKFKK